MAVNHKVVIARIETLLKEMTSPRWDVVIVGQPLSISQKRAVAFWYLGDEPAVEGGTTLTNVMVNEVWMVRGFWEVPDAPQLRDSREVELWDFVRNSKTAFRGDSTLNSAVTDIEIGDAATGFETFASGDTKRVAFYEMRLKDLEAESITP